MVELVSELSWLAQLTVVFVIAGTQRTSRSYWLYIFEQLFQGSTASWIIGFICALGLLSRVIVSEMFRGVDGELQLVETFSKTRAGIPNKQKTL